MVAMKAYAGTLTSIPEIAYLSQAVVVLTSHYVYTKYASRLPLLLTYVSTDRWMPRSTAPGPETDLPVDPPSLGSAALLRHASHRSHEPAQGVRPGDGRGGRLVLRRAGGDLRDSRPERRPKDHHRRMHLRP